jgi:hypothetical protein
MYSGGDRSSERIRPVTHLVLAVPMLFADAPNPADCPHHNCGYYHHVTTGGIAVVVVVVIVVFVLLVLLAIALLLRRRRRRRSRS